MHVNAITRHAVADNDTFIEVDCEHGMVPVAIASSAAVWVPATFTLQLQDPWSGLPGATAGAFRDTDDAAVTLVDDKWTTIPEAMGRKIAAVQTFRILFNTAETGGPVTAYIAWTPLGGA